MSDTETGRPGWERHLHTIFAAATMLYLAWISNAVGDLIKTVAVQSEQISSLRTSLNLAAATSYTDKDAEKDFLLINSRINRLEVVSERNSQNIAELISITNELQNKR